MCDSKKVPWAIEDPCAEIRRNAWVRRKEGLEIRERRENAYATLRKFDNNAKEIRDEIAQFQSVADMPCPDGDRLDRWAGRGRFRLPRSRFWQLPDGGLPLEATCETVREGAQLRVRELQKMLADADRIVAEAEAELRRLDLEVRRQNDEWDNGVRAFQELGCTGTL